MSGELEAAGDVLTGAVIAKTVDGAGPDPAKAGAGGITACRNCGTALTGAYCSACGQPAHIHRSLLSLGHDILHGVFHFEGRIWHTIPELFFKPGRLTRRYIDGERAKFISPMALFLFSVFLTFAVFSFVGDDWWEDDEDVTGQVAGQTARQWQQGHAKSIAVNEREIEKLREQLKAPDLTPERRAAIEGDIRDFEDVNNVMKALAGKDWQKLAELQGQRDTGGESGVHVDPVDSGRPPLNKWWAEKLQKIEANPELLAYKIKNDGYKFSWALIPLSVPCLWLLFFWRRNLNLYDHAIFITYSLSFNMLLLVLFVIAASVGVPTTLLTVAWGIAAPLHLYKQLRYAYGASRFGAALRVFLLSIMISIVLVLFLMLLLALGILG